MPKGRKDKEKEKAKKPAKAVGAAPKVFTANLTAEHAAAGGDAAAAPAKAAATAALATPAFSSGVDAPWTAALVTAALALKSPPAGWNRDDWRALLTPYNEQLNQGSAGGESD